ncbi:hypothetical protein O6H91_04G063800 [Diphasiastrum complanatum]|uniref:Uncharacterized protein n=1 Tax=Diphasiastrum complanatum TaxID=34168 RepID=A0ACC2DXR7_DIPCM|nr:hypothetical protein O6H91_04G063800 [Diphasiastrum complanatum]
MPNSSFLHLSSTPLQHVHSNHHITTPTCAAQAAAIEASEKFNKEGLVTAHWDALHDAYVLEKGFHPVDGPLPEQPSPTIPPKNLKPILIKDLKLGKVHKACALKGTLCTKSLKMQSVVNVLEDETGLATKLVICNALPATYSVLQAQRLYPEGAKVAVLEPYLAEFADGTIGLLVEKPANVIFLWVPENVSGYEERNDTAMHTSPRESVEEGIGNGKWISRKLKSLPSHGTDLDRKQATGLNHEENGASPIQSAKQYRAETNPKYEGKAIVNELQNGDQSKSKGNLLTLVEAKMQPLKEALNGSQTHTANALQSGSGVKLEKFSGNVFPDCHESQATQDSSAAHETLIANDGASVKSDGESKNKQEGRWAMNISINGQFLISERGEMKKEACITNGLTDCEAFISDQDVKKEACISIGSDDPEALISKKEVKKESCVISGLTSGVVDPLGLEPQMKQEAACTMNESTATTAPISEPEIKQKGCSEPKENFVDSRFEILPGSPLLKPAEQKSQNRPQKSNDVACFKPLMQVSIVPEADLIKPLTREHFASGSEIDGNKYVHARNGTVAIHGTGSECGILKTVKDGCSFYSESSETGLLTDAEEKIQHGRENVADGLSNFDKIEALLGEPPLELNHNGRLCKTESLFLTSIASDKPGTEQEKEVKIMEQTLLQVEPNPETSTLIDSKRHSNQFSNIEIPLEQNQCDDQEHSMQLQVDQSQEGNGLQQHQPIRLVETDEKQSQLAATCKDLPNSEINAAKEEPTSDPIELSAASLRFQGNSRFAETDWYGAAELYTQAILKAESSKKHATEPCVATGNDEMLLCYSNRSEAWLRLHLHENARADAEHALGRDPNHVKSLFRMGRALLGLRRASEAQPFLEDARKGAPEDRELHQTLRLCRMMKQQNKQKLKGKI